LSSVAFPKAEKFMDEASCSAAEAMDSSSYGGHDS
jgi:hypothetical protein